MNCRHFARVQLLVAISTLAQLLSERYNDQFRTQFRIDPRK